MIDRCPELELFGGSECLNTGPRRKPTAFARHPSPANALSFFSELCFAPCLLAHLRECLVSELGRGQIGIIESVKRRLILSHAVNSEPANSVREAI